MIIYFFENYFRQEKTKKSLLNNFLFSKYSMYLLISYNNTYFKIIKIQFSKTKSINHLLATCSPLGDSYQLCMNCFLHFASIHVCGGFTFHTYISLLSSFLQRWDEKKHEKINRKIKERLNWKRMDEYIPLKSHKPTEIQMGGKCLQWY